MMHTISLGVCTFALLVSNVLADVILSYEEGDIRLADGPNPLQGRLEIYHDGSWGTVCSDMWDNYNAQVVCRQLGFTDGVLIDNVINMYPSSSGDIFLSNVTCGGSESAIIDCKHNDWSDNGCDHTQDVNVFCKVPSYRGCVVSEYPDYALTGKQVGLPDLLRLDTCMENCENFEFMGLEGGDSCFCGSGSDNYKEYGEADATVCTTPCEGDSSQYCGGPNRMAVYQRGCLTADSSSGVVISPNFPGDYGSNQQCQIQIDLSMNVNTHVTFHLFELTGDDMLTLSDEVGDTVTYTASNPPQLRTIIDSQTLYVNFVSSATSLGGPGYVFTYKVGLLKCPTTIEFANGTLLMENHEFYYEGDTATVMCDDGFEPIEEEIVCTGEGVWSPTPSCIEVSDGEIPDEGQDEEANFEPLLFMCVIIVAVLGLAFFVVFIGIVCTSKQNKAGDKMPLKNAPSSENSEPVNQDMFDSGQGNSNPQVEIEEANAADSDDEEARYFSNLY